jgi:chemotaxis protein CheZ
MSHADTWDERSAGLEALAREIDAVASYLRGLRGAINGLRVPEITEGRLRAAAADLTEVVAATRSATDVILETAEALLSMPDDGPAYRAQVEERMIALMEACSFQDLTGQRLDRVAKTLTVIEERLGIFAASVKAANGEARSGEAELRQDTWRKLNLVHGPGGADALQQAVIDKMLVA